MGKKLKAMWWPLELSFILSLLLLFVGISNGRRCDLGGSDVIFVVQASHDIGNENFDEVKTFIRDFSAMLDVGQSDKQTRVGIVLFDMVREPEYRLSLNTSKNKRDLQDSIDELNLLPCGFWWCKPKYEFNSTMATQFAYEILTKAQKDGRMKKLVLILFGKQYLSVTRELSQLAAIDPVLRVAQILVVPDITEADDPYYQYLLAYYQPYERYISRISQLYPNITVQKSFAQPYSPYFRLPYAKQAKDGVIALQSYEFICTAKTDLCHMIFACPPCTKPVTIGSSTSPAPILNFQDNESLFAVQSDYDYDLANRNYSTTDQPLPAKVSIASMQITTVTTELNSTGSPATIENTSANETLPVLLDPQESLDYKEPLPFDPPAARFFVNHGARVLRWAERKKRQVYNPFPLQRQDQCSCSGAVVDDPCSTESTVSTTSACPPSSSSSTCDPACVPLIIQTTQCIPCPQLVKLTPSPIALPYISIATTPADVGQLTSIIPEITTTAIQASTTTKLPVLTQINTSQLQITSSGYIRKSIEQPGKFLKNFAIKNTNATLPVELKHFEKKRLEFPNLLSMEKPIALPAQLTAPPSAFPSLPTIERSSVLPSQIQSPEIRVPPSPFFPSQFNEKNLNGLLSQIPSPEIRIPPSPEFPTLINLEKPIVLPTFQKSSEIRIPQPPDFPNLHRIERPILLPSPSPPAEIRVPPPPPVIEFPPLNLMPPMKVLQPSPPGFNAILNGQFEQLSRLTTRPPTLIPFDAFRFLHNAQLQQRTTTASSMVQLNKKHQFQPLAKQSIDPDTGMHTKVVVETPQKLRVLPASQHLQILHKLPAPPSSGDYEEFTAAPGSTALESDGGQLESVTESQALVALIDPEPGPIPPLAPPTLPPFDQPDREFLSPVQQQKTSIQLQTLDKRRSPEGSARVSTNQPGNAPGARPRTDANRTASTGVGANRRPIELNEFLNPHHVNEQQQRRKCNLIAVDLIVYIDDSSAMTPKEFTGFKTFLRQFVRIFESDRGRCQRVSRIGVLKNDADGNVHAVLHLTDGLNELKRSVQLGKLNYTGCNINDNPKCLDALSQAYILATSMLIQETNDRKKIFVPVVARTAKYTLPLDFDILQALDFANKYSVDVVAIGLGKETTKKHLNRITNTGITYLPAQLRQRNSDFIDTLCRYFTVPEDEMAKKRIYCPWAPFPVVRPERQPA